MEAERVADARIRAVVAAAYARIERDLARDLPGLSGPVLDWMAGLSHTDRPEDYFLHPEAYPLVQLPLWLLETAGPLPADAFIGDLVYAALSGYYYLRLLDNLVDGDATVESRLLPAANFFQLGASQTFGPYFEHGHPFWSRYRAWWMAFAEATWQDAARESLDRSAFETYAASKTCPEKILVAAACYRSDRDDLLPAWTGLAEAFGRWHQMGDDLRDWAADLKAGRSTYFLSEAERRIQAPETVPGWVAREGYAWGVSILDAYFEALRGAAAGLGSPALERYLADRKRRFDERNERILEGFRAVAGLNKILAGR